MSFLKKSKAHDFTSHLEELCAEGEEPGDKRAPAELRRNSISRKRTLSTGSHHKVSEVKLKDNGLRATQTEFKTKRLSDADRDEILSAMAASAQIDDDHVVRTLGVVTKGKNKLAVVTSKTDEDVGIWLKKREAESGSPLLPKEIYRVLSQVADGMSAIESAGVTHGRLTAKNVFATEGGALFRVGGLVGLELERETAWTAPEVLSGAPATPASDVWSFGVLTIFLFASGDGGIETMGMGDSGSGGSGGSGSAGSAAAQRQEELLASGTRLERPENMPEDVYEICQKCWAEHPSERPDFFWLRAEFEDRASSA